MSTPSIILQNISVQQYGKSLLQGISLNIESNQHIAITGHSGSGKTILAKAIAQQIFYKGNIEIHFTDQTHLQPKVAMASHSEAWKNLSNISDFYYQQRFNSCDAEDAITVQESLNKVHADKTKIEKLLDTFNIKHRINTPLIQLSNGEQKKLQLIKTLLQEAQVLILDNAFTGLDIEARKALHHIINTKAVQGTTIILITDDKELPECITHIAELKEGQLISFEWKENFIASYQHPSSFSKNIPSTKTSFSFNTIIEMKKVQVQYGDKIILQNIDWKVNCGECWLVKGHNGAGKSTLLSLITADNPQAYSNEIYLFDQRRGKGESIWDIKQKIGFVSPELHKYFDTGITTEQAIASGFFDTMGLYKKLNAQQQKAVNDWINCFELTALKNTPLSFLSAGQQRWVLLARALVKQPPLLVLDEPCQGLDEQHTASFIQLIDAIAHQTNTTIIYVSHYTNEIPTCIDKILRLENGIQTIHQNSKTKAA